MSANIAILGAGLLGRVTALSLLNQQAQIGDITLHVFEQQPMLSGGSDALGHHALGYQATAGLVAAAMIAPLAESVHCDADLVVMGEHSLTLWPQLLAALPMPVAFSRPGSLLVAHPQDHHELTAFAQKLKAAPEQMQWLDSTAIAELEPQLAGRFEQGLWLKGEGQLDNLAFFKASQVALQQANVRWHLGASVELRGTQVVVNKQAEQFDLVIDCRGIGSKPQWRSVRGVRGEVLRVHAPEVQLQRPVRLMHPRYSLYIAPKPGQQFVIGATEIESNATANITVRSSLELLSALYTLDPAFAEATILSMQTGLRPTLPDNRPCIRVKPGLLAANGLYRHGYLLAPTVAEALVELTKAQLQPGYQASLRFSQLLTLPPTTRADHDDA